jgi:hypothetical protein
MSMVMVVCRLRLDILITTAQEMSMAWLLYLKNSGKKEHFETAEMMMRNVQFDRYHKLKFTTYSMTPAQWHSYVPPDTKFISLHLFILCVSNNFRDKQPLFPCAVSTDSLSQT